MILVDTSIWIDHIRRPNARLISMLKAELVSMHPWVIGELVCGNLADRANVLYLLSSLPRAVIATDDEVLFFIDKHGISGKGIGYLDMHLLAAAALGSLHIWTRDRRLYQVASSLGLDAPATG